MCVWVCVCVCVCVCGRENQITVCEVHAAEGSRLVQPTCSETNINIEWCSVVRNRARDCHHENELSCRSDFTNDVLLQDHAVLLCCEDAE